MAKKITIKNQAQVENQAYALMEKIWNQSKDKSKLARIITFFVIAVAVIQELYFESHLSNNWYEITVYLLMGYFGMATYRNVFKP